jgi:hypothetical protein
MCAMAQNTSEHQGSSELPRIPKRRSSQNSSSTTFVNKGKKKERGLCDVPRLDQGRTHAARSRSVAMIT